MDDEPDDSPPTRPIPPLPFPATAPGLLRWAAATHPERELAVLGDQRITYAEMERRSAELGRRLLADGVGKGTRVGVLAPNGPEAFVALSAVTRIGAVVVPLNTFQVSEELIQTLDDADIAVVLTVPSLLGNDYLDRLEQGIDGLTTSGPDLRLARLPFLRRVHVFGGSNRRWVAPLADPVDEALLDAAEAAVTPADDQIVVYTSGSTARPKGVIHTHGAIVRQGWFIATHHDWEAGDRVYLPLPFFWIGGYVFGYLWSIAKGLTAVCELRFDPAETLRLLERERVTCTLGWPHIAPALAGHRDFASTDLSRLKGPYHQDLLPPERRVPDPSLLVYTLGMTETGTSHTWWPPDRPLPPEKRGSLGVSAPGWEHKVVDEAGEAVGPEVEGEICVRGSSLMRGIVGRERHEVFDADGWYHTGDGGRIDADGHVYFVGRTGDLIKTAGANVSPIEVEAVLAAMPEIQEVSVVGVPDDVGQVVCAVVALHDGASVDEDELRSRCRERLSAYKVPKRWVFLSKRDIPYTASDKVDKAALVERLAGT